MKSDRSIPIFDLTSFWLYLFMIWISSWALVAADWADHLSLVATVASLAVIAGTALARSLFSARLAFVFATIYAVFAIGWQTTLTLDPSLIWRDRILALLGRIGAFLTVIVNSEPNRDPLIFVIVMAVSLFLALLLFVRSDMNQRQMMWQTLRARVPAGTGSRISRAGVLAAVLLIGVSWVGPT
ncbi:MAG: hypothetical protein GTO14_17220, partial [Anaerolineales bacterium]|nr:hypothetical protein [Anaerolineales bacterium]